MSNSNTGRSKLPTLPDTRSPSSISAKWRLICAVELAPAAFLLDFVEGGVDNCQLVGGEADELLRHAARDQLVGMVLAHEQAIGGAHLVVAGIVRDAQDDIGIVLVGSDMGGAN